MKKNILVVLANLPYPLEHGGDQAMFNNVACIKDDYNVFCVYRGGLKNNYFEKKKILESMWGNVKIIPYIESDKGRSLWGLFNQFVKEIKKRLFSKNPIFKAHKIVESFDVSSPGFYAFIHNCIKENNIDIVQIEMLYHASLVLHLPASVKKIFVHHELRFVTNEISYGSKINDLYLQACVKQAKILEIGLMNCFDAVVTLSQIDSDKLRKAGVVVPIYTSKAIVSSDVHQKVESNFNGILTYIGPESHMPNYLAVQWFLENCWDRLLQENPNYRFRVIGKWSQKTIEKITKKYTNVEFTGFVEVLRPYLEGSISIIPLTVGSGIRMKILETASMGIPFVSTSIGAEGLPFKNEVDCYIADTPESFVRSIIALNEEERRMSFTLSAKQKVEKDYSMDALRRDRINLYEKMCCLDT